MFFMRRMKTICIINLLLWWVICFPLIKLMYSRMLHCLRNMTNSLQHSFRVNNLKYFATTAHIREDIFYRVFRTHNHPSLLCYNKDWLCNLFCFVCWQRLFAESQVPLENEGRKKWEEKLKHFQKLYYFHLFYTLSCCVFTIQHAPAKCSVTIALNKCSSHCC